ncbi:MAG: peptidylprolyl isomerase [Bacillota bacterium]|nr:peptidylprolyl isomerase [Bacillota bacterium]
METKRTWLAGTSGKTLLLGLAVGFLGIVVAVLALLLPRGSQAVATVNGEPISKEELYQEMYARTGKQTLEEMITRRLVAQEGKKQGISVSDAEVKAEIERIIKEQFDSEEEFMNALSYYGMTRAMLEENIRTDLTIKKLLGAKAQVTEDEVRAYFDQHREEFDQPEMVHARHILVATEQEAREVRQRLLEGADFAALAREKSADPGSSQGGGDLGFFGRGTMVPEFEEAAFALAVGDISQPVKSQHGYHIIQVLEKRPAQAAEYEKVKEEVRKRVTDDKIQGMVPEWIDSLRAAAKIQYHVPD